MACLVALGFGLGLFVYLLVWASIGTASPAKLGMV
jgi:hypothetical protein